MDRLSDLFRNLGNSLELEDIFSTLDEELRRLMVYDVLSVHMVESTGLATVYATCGDKAWLRTEVGDDVLAQTAVGRQPGLHCTPCELGSDFGQTKSALTFPIERHLDKERRLTAVLVLQRDAKNPFSHDDLDILKHLAPKLSACIENPRKYRCAEQLVEADPLTGLANRRSLFLRLDAELARARRCRDTLAVLECSIQGFDRSGRLCSPAATRSAFEKVALTLRENCREYDFAACSGDEFVLILPGFRPVFLEEKCELIRRIVEEAGVSAGFPLFASVGAAFFPEDGSDAEDLLAAAACRANLARQSASGRSSGVS